MIKTWGPDVILTTGDNNYPAGAASSIDDNIGQYFHEYIAPYHGKYGTGSKQNRFFPALGNHDLLSLAGQPYLDYFTLPGNERYYDFTWGPAHFFALDSDLSEPDSARVDSIQATWLKEKLAGSDSPWNLVYFHHAPYSSGLHGSSVWMRWPFKEWGASAVIAGHDHTYERLSVDGIPCFVNGLGGAARYGFNDRLPESQVRFNSAYGAMLVNASQEAITFQFISVQGEVIDSFEILAEPQFNYH